MSKMIMNKIKSISICLLACSIFFISCNSLHPILKSDKVVGYYTNGYVMNKERKVIYYYANGYVMNKNQEVIYYYKNGYVLNL